MTSPFLARLSSRACAMLRRRPPAEGRPSTREAIAARLEACGRPVYDAVVDFELSVLDLAWPGHELGIIYYEPDPLTDEPDDPERTMVPIGSTWDRNTTLFMGEHGEIAFYAGYVAMRNASIYTCLEQHAMTEARRFPEPWFALRLDSAAVASRLPSALGLDPLAPASDAFEAWWQNEELEFGVKLFGNQVTGSLRARTLAGLSESMAEACRLDASVGFDVGAQPTDTSAGMPSRASRSPTADLWRHVPGARRYPRLGRSAGEAVWVVAGPRWLEIQQYWGETWETLGPRGGIRRELREKPWIDGRTPGVHASVDASTEAARARWLASLSPRARAFLLQKTRPLGRPTWPADCGGIEAQIREYRYEPLEPLVTFEILLGGRDVDIGGRTLHLGVLYGFLRPGEPAMVEGTGALKLAPSGEISGSDSFAPFPRSVSVTSFIEQLALLDEATSGPAPAFTVDVHDADADLLSAALSLASVGEAVDPYQQWWQGDGVTLFRSTVPDCVVPEIVRAYTRRIDAAVRVLAATRALAHEARFELNCTLQMSTSCARAAVPTGGADLVPPEHRYRYGADSAYVEGEIYVVSGSEARIEQRRALGGVVYGWDTLTDEASVVRVVRDDP